LDTLALEVLLDLKEHKDSLAALDILAQLVFKASQVHKDHKALQVHKGPKGPKGSLVVSVFKVPKGSLVVSVPKAQLVRKVSEVILGL